MNKLKLLWVDLSVSGADPELPDGVALYCDVSRCVREQAIDQQLQRGQPDAVFFDFDYPDKTSLRMTAGLKEAFPSLPMVLLTVQHSEALAVWAFRSRFTDYLIRPVPQADLDRCLLLLEEIAGEKRAQPRRRMPVVAIPMPEEIPAATMTASSLLPALHYIENNLTAKITGEDMARLCSMSPFRFGRAFKDAFGISFRDYVVQLRLKEASRLLENPQAQVTQVAYSVGFNDMSYFSRMFKRHFGVSPSAVQGARLSDSRAAEPKIELPSLRLPDLQHPG